MVRVPVLEPEERPTEESDERAQRLKRTGSTGRWWAWLGVITLLALGVRLAAVLVLEPHLVPKGDAIGYHYGANILVEGHGFVNPYVFLYEHRSVPGADYPPLFTMVLAIASLFGFKSFFAHQIWASIIGTSAVVVVGLAGREIAGRRVGLVAAFLAAVYPNIWINDAFVHAETLSIIVVSLVLWMAYRFWRQPSIWRAVAFGAVEGLAILARDELVLLVFLLLVPLVLLARSQPLRRRVGMLGATLLSSATLIAPWVGFNMSRFADPVFISTGLGVTLASANCATTYSGPAKGYWSLYCVNHPGISVAHLRDESIDDARLRTDALNYAGAHSGELPGVIGARVGRAFAFYAPLEQVRFDVFVEDRSRSWAFVGLYAYYVLLALAVAGLVLLRRRKVTILPLIAVTINVLITVMITFGQTRYRVPFEVVLVLASAVALDHIAETTGLSARVRQRISGRRPTPADSGTAPSPMARGAAAVQE